MSEKRKVKLAFADALIMQLWWKGYITAEEREEMLLRCGKIINKSVC